jgi:hypothetical protein
MILVFMARFLKKWTAPAWNPKNRSSIFDHRRKALRDDFVGPVQAETPWAARCLKRA